LVTAFALAKKFSYPERNKGISLVDALLLLEAEDNNTFIYTSDELMTRWINKHNQPSAILFK
jgi:hypothetical protein